jgi:transcriptional regulator with PAS, ATPase and Fis domain
VDGGTLFLDEIDMLTPTLQAKLLRAIEGGGYSAVGSTVIKNSDFRIIGATNSEDLMEHRSRGSMRKDFFYRIHIIPIHLPPLRHRKGDIPLLLEHFLKLYSKEEKILALPGHMLQAFMNYDWPGNVRELQNVIQRYLAVERFELPSASVSGSDDSRGRPQPAKSIAGGDPLLRKSLEGTEKASIRDALDRCHGNRGRAAAVLGISRMTLYRKMKRLELA